jgi:hypothetical protein
VARTTGGGVFRLAAVNEAVGKGDGLAVGSDVMVGMNRTTCVGGGVAVGGGAVGRGAGGTVAASCGDGVGAAAWLVGDMLGVAVETACRPGVGAAAVTAGCGAGPPPLQPLNRAANPTAAPTPNRNRPATRILIGPHLHTVT